jgi:hypothetical protein
METLDAVTEVLGSCLLLGSLNHHREEARPRLPLGGPTFSPTVTY